MHDVEIIFFGHRDLTRDVSFNGNPAEIAESLCDLIERTDFNANEELWPLASQVLLYGTNEAVYHHMRTLAQARLNEHSTGVRCVPKNARIIYRVLEPCRK